MHHDAAVWQRKAHARFARSQQQGSHRRGLPDHQCRHLWADVLHCVIDRQTRCHNAAWAVDIHRNFFGWVFRLKVQQLRHNQARHGLYHQFGAEPGFLN